MFENYGYLAVFSSFSNRDFCEFFEKSVGAIVTIFI
jgi:hypothetical protein